jgi:hypothetical protein
MLKGTNFVSVEEVKAKTMDLLNSLTENDLYPLLSTVAASYAAVFKLRRGLLQGQ